ncbi:HD-GYP domain-containing protein [Alkalibacillus almallahensis]|uniref:HD-GYP domain-containing protein n=1 Tax=Alkalibacillus almallahensis TaxID=1379154 RepID=UPI001422B30F|nr:HD-GYP domain-containing protein [Alkalibacillus almallahensis]NIK12772.1 HD-GYP domain-containing protein (c-di-GMP phosphodiesterase class II) [Alkalibacillus almallahensis]
MKVHPQQIVPGCLVTKDVIGNTVTPIIPRNTVVEPIHIQVLEKFRINEVEVANKLVTGEEFEAKELTEEEQQSLQKLPFFEHFVDVVKETRIIFENWDYRTPLDSKKIRELILPLTEQAEDKRDVILKLHHYNDPKFYMYYHMVAMAVISTYLAKRLGYDESERHSVALAAYLSDLGMLKSQKDVYLKERSLDYNEYEQIQKHPIESYRLLEKEPFNQDVKIAVLQHHERLDGSGYPLGVKMDKLHRFAKILAVADMFHAMTSERMYRQKQSPYKVIEEMRKDQLTQLDMEVLNELVRCFVNFGNGTEVKLSNSEYGTIVFTDERYPTRPLVRLRKDKEILNLIDEKDLYIEEIL